MGKKTEQLIASALETGEFLLLILNIFHKDMKMKWQQVVDKILHPFCVGENILVEP